MGKHPRVNHLDIFIIYKMRPLSEGYKGVSIRMALECITDAENRIFLDRQDAMGGIRRDLRPNGARFGTGFGQRSGFREVK